MLWILQCYILCRQLEVILVKFSFSSLVQCYGVIISLSSYLAVVDFSLIFLFNHNMHYLPLPLVAFSKTSRPSVFNKSICRRKTFIHSVTHLELGVALFRCLDSFVLSLRLCLKVRAGANFLRCDFASSCIKS